MLDEYKQIYQQEANKIKNWQETDKNELCRLYIKNEKTNLKDNYLSAIIYKYWNLINTFYEMSKNVATPEDVYEWMIDSIMYALKHRRWEDENSSIYNDPNGPDKVINRCMKCRRYTYYQALNRQKRKDGTLYLSLDEMMEDYKDCNDIFKEPDEPENRTNFEAVEIIKTAFENQQYLTAFMIDEIIDGNTYNIKKVEHDDSVNEVFCFNEKKLVKRLKEIDYDKISEFAKKYNLDTSKIEKKSSYIIKDDKEIKDRIKEVLNKMKINFRRGIYDAN